MNVATGALYETMQAALDAGEREEDLVEVIGTREQAERVSTAIQRMRCEAHELETRRCV